MVREGRQEPRQEAAEEQRAGGAGEDHQHGGSKLKGNLSSLYVQNKKANCRLCTGRLFGFQVQ